MPNKFLIIPLGYSWVRGHRGVIFSDAQGKIRIKAAIDFGINQELRSRDVLYGVMPGVIPPARGGDGCLSLGEAMVRTFAEYGILTERIVRGNSNVWGSYMEVDEGLRIAEEMHRAVVFVTSTYHVPRLMLVCREILGYHAFRRKFNWGTLDVRGCGNERVSTRDLLTEPVKYVAQALRIPFGRFMPKTLHGRL